MAINEVNDEMITKGNGLFPRITKLKMRVIILSQGKNILACWFRSAYESGIYDGGYIASPGDATPCFVRAQTEEDVIELLYEAASIQLSGGRK